MKDTNTPTGSSTPWRDRLPTLTGSCKVVTRYRINSGIEIRTLEGFEYMRLIGWDDSYWRLDEQSIHPEERDIDYPELLANMAGNAYSVWHFGPWAIASLATFGKFYVDKGSASEAEAASEDAFRVESADTESVMSSS